MPRRPVEPLDGSHGGAQAADHARAVIAVAGRGVEPAQLGLDLLDGRQRVTQCGAGLFPRLATGSAVVRGFCLRRGCAGTAALADTATVNCHPATSGPMLVNAGEDAVASRSGFRSSSSQNSDNDMPAMSSEVTNSPMSGLYGWMPCPGEQPR